MHPRSQPALVALSLSLAFAVPAVAHADRAPNPKQIEEVRKEEVKSPSPDAAPTPPPNPADPLAAKPETKVETRVETKTDAAKDAEKTESGGMCRVGAPAGGWELLVLAGLGLRARRRS